jgi:hypothetical protein
VSEREKRVRQQFKLARSKVEALLLDPVFEGMDSNCMVGALLGAAIEVALTHLAPHAESDDAREFMIGAINIGFDSWDGPELQ